MNSVVKIAERDVQKACIDLLNAERIWNMRLNAGAMAGRHKGKKWFVRFGKKGMADILAIDQVKRKERYRTIGMSGEGAELNVTHQHVFWIEVKNPQNGKQTDDQKNFQAEVEAEGQTYLLIDDVDDLRYWLREKGVTR